MLAFKLENFADTLSIDKLADLYEPITEQRLTVKDTGINYRVINHWDNKGLIRFGRNSKEGNRKFSFVDFIWIKVVNELRSFGVQLPLIKKIADDVYEPLPVLDMMDSLAKNIDAMKGIIGEGKEEFIEYLKSGQYKTISADEVDQNANYLQVLIVEALASNNMVSLIVFDDGEWFPYIKNKEHNYPEELIRKKESRSQVRISLSEIIYRYVVLDAFKEYSEIFKLFNTGESGLLNHIREGDYKKILVLFKSKKRDVIEIKKSKTALAEVAEIIREGEYKEFILTDKKGKEFRIRENSPHEDAAQLKERERIFAEFAPAVAERKTKYRKNRKAKPVK